MKKNLGAAPMIFPQPVLILATYDENGVVLSVMIRLL